MAISIPTFRLDISEGMIDVDTSADRLFGYCIEATQGPVMEPTFVASKTEAQRIFGDKNNFAPHFYQKPTGLVLCRVGFDGMAKPALTYKAYPTKKVENEIVVDKNGTQFDVIKIEGLSEGTADYTVNITPSLTNNGYNLSVKIENVTSKSYQGLANLNTVVRRINTKFSNYMVAKIVASEEQLKGFKKEQLIIKVSPNDQLSGGSNGFLKKTDGTTSNVPISSNGSVPDTVGTGAANSEIEGGHEYSDTDPNSQVTLMLAYRKAFEKMRDVDLVGIATLSDKEIVQNELVQHIVDVTDPEVAQLRFGITGYLDYAKKIAEETPISVEDVYSKAATINNEYIIYIGQGVVFKEEDKEPVELLPHECVQLYTGIRSALGYSEAIFGGEAKKVLVGVKDTLPVITDTDVIIKEYIEELNEHGVCTFKKEYGDVTFVEGVTTTQEHDVLSYESIMSIVVHVTKRLIRVAKPYQGQNLNEDLKSSLTTALSNELKSIVETDGTLIALEDYNIPPYDVSVKSAAVTTFNEAGELIRESKIIIQCKIVPIGALRDVDLGVIVI